jgi:aryl-alcohol dehydrogenase-like predicted oxidoreductase
MRYKVFRNTGLRVSEVALGTGTFGTRWGSGAGALRSLDPAREATLFLALEATAREAGASLAQVAIAWVRAMGMLAGTTFIPIIGARTINQLCDAQPSGLWQQLDRHRKFIP